MWRFFGLASAGFLLLALAGTATAGEAGSTGFKFLQMNPDAASMALGGAYATARGEATAVAGNPAGLAGLESYSAAVSHSEWLSTIRYGFAGAAFRSLGGVVGVSLRTQSSGDIPLRTADTGGVLSGIPAPEPLGTYGVYDAALTFGYGRATGWGDVGGTLSYVYEKIHTDDAAAVVASFGTQRRVGSFTLGAVARNLGYSTRMRNDRTPVPWDIQAGGGFERCVREVPVRVVADLRYAPDWHETVHLGAQATFARQLALRLGYESGLSKNVSTAGVSGGVGFVRGVFRLDYTYQPERYELGSRHVIAVALRGTGGRE